MFKAGDGSIIIIKMIYFIRTVSGPCDIGRRRHKPNYHCDDIIIMFFNVHTGRDVYWCDMHLYMSRSNDNNHNSNNAMYNRFNNYGDVGDKAIPIGVTLEYYDV